MAASYDQRSNLFKVLGNRLNCLFSERCEIFRTEVRIRETAVELNALFQSDARTVLDAILGASEDAIVGTDASGRIVVWNRGAQRMYGYAPEEIIGRSLSTLVPTDRILDAEALIHRLAAGEVIDAHDAEHISKDGRRIEASLSAMPLRQSGGGIAGGVLIARNLTGERRIDRAFRSGEARWRSIVESAVDGIITIDHRGRIETFNPAAERLFGYSRDEVLGRNVSMLMPAPYQAEHDHYLKRYLDTHDAKIIGIGREVTGLRKDGTTFPMHLSVGEVLIEGGVRFTGIVRDLTDRVALEQKLREESGLARIGELAAVLAHEVKNPLAAVSGAVQMISGVLPPHSDERQITTEVLQRLDGLSALMGDLLLYARPPHPSPAVIDGLELVNNLVAFFRQDPAWRELSVEVRGTATAIADPELLKIALQNLLLNAAQATRGRGRVNVELAQTDGVTTVEVSDNGPGIPANVRERVFTPFFTTKARGTGLGLATVKQIAEAHGGGISIAATSSSGTTMRLTLPVSKPLKLV